VSRDLVFSDRRIPQTCAIAYDEAARKQWATFAQNCIAGFDPNISALSVDRELLHRCMAAQTPTGAGDSENKGAKQAAKRPYDHGKQTREGQPSE